MLKGLIFGPTGAAMTPAYTRRRGRLYRYYVAVDAIKSGASGASPIRRVAAAEIEAIVLAQIKAMLRSPEIIVATWRAARNTLAGITEHQVADSLRRFDEVWSELFPAEQARIVQLLVERVDLGPEGADITLNVEGLASVVADLRAGEESKRDAA